jgi:hypothetical protein
VKHIRITLSMALSFSAGAWMSAARTVNVLYLPPVFAQSAIAEVLALNK